VKVTENSEATTRDTSDDEVAGSQLIVATILSGDGKSSVGLAANRFFYN